MSTADLNPWTATVRIAGAGLGAAVGGPLGAALGGWLGDALGAPAGAIIREYAEKFGEKAAEKLLDVGADSLAEKLKARPPRLEGAYREALRRSLKEIHSQMSGDGFDDWFANWESCLSAPVPLNLSSIELGQLAPEQLVDFFRNTMESLDAQGAAISRGDLSLTPRCRRMPDLLLAEITARLQDRLRSNFNMLITKPEYEQAWKDMQLIFQQFADAALRRIDQTMQRVDRTTQVLPQIAEDTVAIRNEIADFRVHLTQRIVAQAATKQRKTWRDLFHLFMPIVGSVSDASNEFLISELFMGLDRTFRDRPYCQFTGQLRYVERNVQGQTVPMYYLLCHQIDFCESVRRTTELFIRSYYAAKNDPKAREQLIAEQQKLADAFNREWNANAAFDLSSEWLPLEFTVDSAKRVISIRQLPMSLDPLTYVSGITSTSELMRFLASYMNAGHVKYFGDAAWYNDNYSLLKLWADFADHRKIEIARVRINADDYEEWDYVNPSVDLEIKNSKK
jgi:hypothetical protein